MQSLVWPAYAITKYEETGFDEIKTCHVDLQISLIIKIKIEFLLGWRGVIYEVNPHGAKF